MITTSPGNGKKSPFLEREVILPRELSNSWDREARDGRDAAPPEENPVVSSQEGQEANMRPSLSTERLDMLQLEMNPPVDRWNLMYLTLVLHGVGTLMPWNIFINAKTVSYVSLA